MNKDNLKPIQKGELTKEEAKRRGSIGGSKSVEARKEKKLFKQAIEERLGETLDDMVEAMISQVLQGNVNAATWVRDTVGQKPIDKMEVTENIIDISKRIDEYARNKGN